jgi:glucose/arabinose dehydrogenase
VAQRLFFVNYTDREGHTRIVRYATGPDPDRADAASAELVLLVEQPYTNHHGGHLLFGPDGYLYIGLGDGGSKGDPENRAQDEGTLLGKMLRIDVNRRDEGRAYAIPPDNPWAGKPGARPEIWAKGLRNPWRYSFDRETGDLWIADVGQDHWEEIDVQPAASRGGENYGWRLMEGSHCYEPKRDCDDGSLVKPIYEYSHFQGCSITGGALYRGRALPALCGRYLFADWCEGKVWALDPATRSAEQILKGQRLGNITSFGEDLAGELYLIDGGGGRIWKITPKSR